MKILLSCFSFALFAFLYFGVVLHTSEGAQFLGKYSAKYMLVVVAVTFAALPWAWATRSLVSESEVTLRSGRMFVIRPQHKVLFYSLLFALLSLCAEGALRLTDVKPPPASLDLYHPYLQNALSPKDVELHVNRHGFRGEDMAIAKSDGTFRIFVLGGSTVLSSRVHYKKSHVRLLGLALQELFAQAPDDDRKVEIQNAGNHWHTSQHSLMKYLFQVKDFDPDLVIVWHGINDLYRWCSPPRFSRGDYQADYSHFWGPTAEMVMAHELLPDPKPLIGFGESMLARRLSTVTNALYQDFRSAEPIRFVDVDAFASLPAFSEICAASFRRCEATASAWSLRLSPISILKASQQKSCRT
jgi:hypothetical protein